MFFGDGGGAGRLDLNFCVLLRGWTTAANTIPDPRLLWWYVFLTLATADLRLFARWARFYGLPGGDWVPMASSSELTVNRAPPGVSA